MNMITLPAVVCSFMLLLQSCSKKSGTDGGPVVVAPPVNNSRTFYVATTGNDANTLAQAKNVSTPWKTIQKAVNSITGGDTVIVMGGIYNETVSVANTASGTAAATTFIKAKDGETVIVDGGVANPNSAVVRWVSQFNINGAQRIKIQGIKVQNANWYGFRVENNSSFITIDGCSTFNTGASGIYVNTCTNVDIVNNKVLKACQVTTRDASGNGIQECITLTRTSIFKVNNNEVGESTVNGSAGGEGIDVKGSSFNGEVSGNYIHDILVLGIYIDAGTGEEYNIRVFNNKVYRTYGLGVAGELGGHAHEIYFYNNIITDSDKSGIVFQETGNGRFTNVYVVNNTFYNNALNGFAGDVGSYTRNTANSNNVIRNNIFYNKISNSRFSIWHNYPAGHVISNNLYFDFKPSLNSTLSFTAANLTAADVKDIDPLFVNIAGGDFSLQGTSPAINKGVVITLPSSTTLLFTTDITGKTRGTANWDMGAYEF
jgi:Right handed beta helix region